MTPVEIVEVTVSPVYPRNDKQFPSERILQIMFMMMLPTAKRIVTQTNSHYSLLKRE
ncbi:hypothetical protein [Brevibacillus sp. SYSU BS000544]|uniref:hypothetical protein n=1 Tax=Brevibacillus sp. SYSU BS000544 TaxID=3416443 RepID=UPI003CE47F13